MFKNFKKELRLIRANNRISEKLLTLAIYNEFYNDLMDITREDLQEDYTLVIEKTFEVVVRSINSRNNRNVSAEKFMSIYFSAIKKNKLFNTPAALKVINTIESQLGNAKDTLKFAPIVDNFQELTLDSKLDIMLEFREYANDLWMTINDLFGESKTANLRYNVFNVLNDHLAKYLKYCKAKNIAPNDISRRIRPMMMKVIKKYLMFELNHNRFGAQYVPNTSDFEFFNNFNDLEQKIWLMEVIYEIAGYSNNDKLIDNKKIKEICDSLGISKIRYTLTNLSMGLSTLKAVSKLRNCDNKEMKR